jgi:hypothetical protein
MIHAIEVSVIAQSDFHVFHPFFHPPAHFIRPVGNIVTLQHIKTHIIIELLLEVKFRGDRGHDCGGEEGKE